MDEKKLNWEKKEKLNFTNILDQINDVSKEIVHRELQDITSKINALHGMGFIKDCDLKKLNKEMEKLNDFNIH